MLNPTLIRRADLLSRLISFDGLERHRGITPTDVDAIMDYGGRAWWIAECKYQGNKMPSGQQMALQRMANSLPNCLLIVCEHTSTEGAIELKDCTVTQMYWQGEWTEPRMKRTVLQTVEIFEQRLKNKGIAL